MSSKIAIALTLALAALALWLEPLSDAVVSLQAHGRAPVRHLLMVPVGVLAIISARVLVGLETFGLLGPLLLGFAFSRVGPLLGLGLFGGLLVMVTPLRLLLERVPLLSVSRTGVLVMLCAAALLVVTSAVRDHAPALAAADLGLPVVAMASMIDRFVTAQMDQSPGEALKLSVYTLVTATLVSFLVGSAWLADQLIARPDVVWFCVPAGLVVGRYGGLRLLELARFRPVART